MWPIRVKIGLKTEQVRSLGLRGTPVTRLPAALKRSKPVHKSRKTPAQLQESVDAPAADHPNNTTKRYMKKGRSFTPLNCALNPLIFELRDSADALVDLLTK
jgi:hypothetical protein